MGVITSVESYIESSGEGYRAGSRSLSLLEGRGRLGSVSNERDREGGMTQQSTERDRSTLALDGVAIGREAARRGPPRA